MPDSELSEVVDDRNSWAGLPLVPLVKIFQYLSPAERHRAASVCKNWSRVLSDPSLWRNLELRYKGDERRSMINHIKNTVRTAERFGQYVRTLRVVCRHAPVGVCKMYGTALQDVGALLVFSGCQLREFSSRFMHADLYWKNPSLREGMVSSICRLLRQQSSLTQFNMEFAMLTAKDGLKILDAAGEGMRNNSRPKTVLIIHMFKLGSLIISNSLYHKFIGSLRNVCKLHLNYSCLSNDAINNLSKTSQNCLSEIFVKISRYDHLGQGHTISGQAWKALHKACPSLVVKVLVEGIGKYEAISRLLPPGIGAQELKFFIEPYHRDDNLQLNRTLRHLATVLSHSLVDCSLTLSIHSEQIDEGVKLLFQQCTRMRRCKLKGTFSLSVIEWLFKSRNEDKIACHFLDVVLIGKTLAEMVQARLLEKLIHTQLKKDVLYTIRGL